VSLLLQVNVSAAVAPNGMRNEGGVPFPSPERQLSLDRATVRLETLIGFFDFGPKKVPVLLRNLITLSPTPTRLVSMGPDLWNRSSPGQTILFVHMEQIQHRSNFTILLKHTKSIKPLTIWHIQQSNTFPPTCRRPPRIPPTTTRISIIRTPCPLPIPPTT